MHFQDILQTIGDTPLVKINRLNPNPDVAILAKVEGNNPGGSIKDRIAVKMIEQAEYKGDLKKDKIIIEPTSGNTGISLAMIGAIKGYHVEIVMSEAVSIERQKMLKAFGTKVTLTPADQGTDEAIVPSIYDPSQIDEEIMVDSETAFEYSRKIVKEEGVFVGMSSGAAMYTALEIVKKLDKGMIVLIFPDRGEKYLSTDLFKV